MLRRRLKRIRFLYKTGSRSRAYDYERARFALDHAFDRDGSFSLESNIRRIAFSAHVPSRTFSTESLLETAFLYDTFLRPESLLLHEFTL